MKKIIPSLAILATAILLTLPENAMAQSQGARADYYRADYYNVMPPKKVQRRSAGRYVDTSCYTYGGYGWGPYFGPCPFRGEVYAVQPGPPVFGPLLPFGPYW